MEFLSLDPGAELRRTTPTLLSFLNSLSSGHTALLSLQPRKEVTHCVKILPLEMTSTQAQIYRRALGWQSRF